MASRGDISAGKAFVELYVRDYAFRRRLAEDEQLFEEVTSQFERLGVDESPQAAIEFSGTDALSILYDDTDILTQATWDLNDALEAVMDTYDQLSGFQQEGITLNAGGGGQQAIPDMRSGDTKGFDKEQLKVELMEGLEEIPREMLTAVSRMAGKGLIKNFTKAGEIDSGSELSNLASSADKAADALMRVASNVGESPFKPGYDPNVGESPFKPGYDPNVGESPFKPGDGIPMAELVKPGDGIPMAELVKPGDGIPMAELVKGESPFKPGYDPNVGESPFKPGFSPVGKSPFKPGYDPNVGKSPFKPGFSPVGEIAGAAGDSASSLSGLAAGASSVTAALGPMAIAAAVAVPLLAAIDEETSGTLSKSGMYPAWLKSIGDGLNSFGPIGPILKGLVKSLMLLWDAIKLNFKIMVTFLKVALFPLRMAVKALLLPITLLFKAVKLLKFAFSLPGKAMGAFKSAIKALPGLAMKSLKALRDLAGKGLKLVGKGFLFVEKSAIAAAKGVVKIVSTMASGSWKAWSASINAISSGMRKFGKVMAIAGGVAAALGAAITVPLTRAAKQFQEHGSRVSLMTKQYRHLGLSAEDASVYMYAASQAGGELGAMGEQERIKNIMMSTDRSSQAFKEWRKQAEASGQYMSVGMVSSAALLGIAYKRLRDSLSGLWKMLGAAVAPAITDTTEVMVGAIRAVTAWVKDNQKLIATVFKVAGAVGMAGTAIAAAGGVLFTLGSALTPITALLAAVAGGMAIVEYRTKAGATFIGSYKDSVMGMYETVRSILPKIMGHFQDTFGGIKDAIKGGDLKLAAEIAWAGMKVAWMEGLTWLSEKTGGVFGSILANMAAGKWSEAAKGIKDVVVEAFQQVKEKATDIWIGIVDKADELWVGIVDSFDNVMTQLQVSWMRLVEEMKKPLSGLLLDIMGVLATAEQYDPTGVAAKAYKVATDARRKILESSKTEEEITTDIAGIETANDTRAEAREEKRLERFSKRRSFVEDIADIEEKSSSGADAIAEADTEVALLKAELARLRKEAKGKAEEMVQPEGIDKIKGTSSMVTSSAYAFGQYGNAKAPQQAMVEEIKGQRDDAQKRDAESKRIGERFMKWMDENPNLSQVLENLGFFEN